MRVAGEDKEGGRGQATYLGRQQGCRWAGPPCRPPASRCTGPSHPLSLQNTVASIAAAPQPSAGVTGGVTHGVGALWRSGLCLALTPKLYLKFIPVADGRYIPGNSGSRVLLPSCLHDGVWTSLLIAYASTCNSEKDL